MARSDPLNRATLLRAPSVSFSRTEYYLLVEQTLVLFDYSILRAYLQALDLALTLPLSHTQSHQAPSQPFKPWPSCQFLSSPPNARAGGLSLPRHGVCVPVPLNSAFQNKLGASISTTSLVSHTKFCAVGKEMLLNLSCFPQFSPSFTL